jgi:hypothetical protein
MESMCCSAPRRSPERASGLRQPPAAGIALPTVAEADLRQVNSYLDSCLRPAHTSQMAGRAGKIRSKERTIVSVSGCSSWFLRRLSSCGLRKVSGNNAGTPGGGQPQTTNISQSVAWQNEGPRLEAARAGMPNLTSPAGEEKATSTYQLPAAYESLPINIDAAGRYTLLFGPMPSNVMPRRPAAFGFAFPSDASFNCFPSGSVNVVRRGDSRYLGVSLSRAGKLLACGRVGDDGSSMK